MLRHPIGWLVLFYVACSVLFLSPQPTADGLAYFGQTRSILLDGDVDLAEELSTYVGSVQNTFREIAPRDFDGSFPHFVNLGVVLLFAPFFLLGHAVAAIAPVLGFRISMDGYDQPYVMFVALAAPVLVLAAMLLLVRFLRPHVGIALAVLAALAVWAGSSLFPWTFYRPTHTHAPSVIVEAAFVVLFLTAGRRPNAYAAYAVLGVLGGFLLTLRPITGVYSVVPGVFLALVIVRVGWAAARARGSYRARLEAAVRGSLPPVACGLLFLAGSLLGRLPQFVFARDFGLVGSSFYSETGYLDSFGPQVFQGMLSLLFDPRQGLLWWSPIVPVALLGLGWFWRRDRFTFWATLGFVALVWIFVAGLGYPQRFGGQGVDSRHLVEATPLYVIAAAGLFAGVRDLRSRPFGPRVRRLVRVLPLLLGVLVLWGFLTHLAVHLGAQGDSPLARVATLLQQPTAPLRLFGGRSFIASFLGEFIEAPARRPLLMFVLFAGSALVAGLVLARLVGREGRGQFRGSDRRGEPSAADGPAHLRIARSAMVLWIGVIVLVGVAIAPAMLPRDARLVDGAVIGSRERPLDARMPPTGAVTEIRIGSSPTGNAVIDPPPPRQPELVAAESAGVAQWLDLGSGTLSTTFSVPAGYSALTHMAFWLEGSGPDGAVEIRAWSGSASGDPALTTTALAPAFGSPGAAVFLPLPLAPDGDTVTIEIGALGAPPEDAPPEIPPPESAGIRVGVDAAGEPAFRAYGIAQQELPTVALGGTELIATADAFAFSQAGTVAFLPDGQTAMRLGPWGAPDMLLWAEGATGWRFPGPTSAEETWNDSLTPVDGADGAEIVYRVRSPSAMRDATMFLVASAYDRQSEGTLTAETRPTGGGGEWRSPGVQAVTGRFQVLEIPLEVAGKQDVQVRIRLAGTGMLGLNVVWLDAPLSVPAWSDAVGAPASTLELDQPATVSGREADGGLPVQLRLEDPLGPLSSIAWKGGELVHDSIGGWERALIGFAVFLALAGAAWILRRRQLALPLLAVAGFMLVAGLVRIPRTIVLPETLTFAGGDGLGVLIREQRVIASASGDPPVIYFSTPIPISPGAESVQRVDVTATGANVRSNFRFREREAWSLSQSGSAEVPPGTRQVQVLVDFGGPERPIYLRFIELTYLPRQ